MPRQVVAQECCTMSRRAFIALGGIAGATLFVGCSGGGTTAGAAASASAVDSTGFAAGAIGIAGTTLTVGTLATEDLLPLWVAQEEGLPKTHGIALEIIPFQSATELIAGVASGEVDLAMTDIMVSASMFASGIEVSMRWVTLGTTPDQGRFGIMAGPNSQAKTLEDLAGTPIGVGSNTILEYVMDKLMLDAGVPADQILVEEIQKLPVRFQAMATGEVAAAALPGSLLALGEAQGYHLIADDTQGDNLSQSVMIARTDALADASKAAAIENLQQVWDKAVDLINANPEVYRATLIQNAGLSDVIADTYPICTYPAAQLPTSSMVEPVLAWMNEKGYLTTVLTYDEATGSFALA